MADLFNPTNAFRSLEQAFEKKTQSRQRLGETLVQTQEEVTTINRDHASDLNYFAAQSDRINDAAMEAMDRLEAIDSNPEIVNRVMALFGDENYSRTAQERKLQRAQWETAHVSGQMKTKDDLRRLKLQEASQDLQLAEQMYQFDQQGFLDQAQLMELGFQVEAQIDKKILQTATQASIEDLAKWRKDPKSAPASLRDKPGLLDTVFFQRKAEEQGFMAGEQLAEIREFEIMNLRQKRALNEMDDKALFGALKTGNLPEGVSRGAAQDEWERRQSVDYALAAAERAAVLGNIEVEGQSKLFALSKMTTDQIQLLLQGARESQTGTFQHGNLRFTEQELTNAYEAAYQRDVQRQQARNDVIIGMAGMAGSLDRADASIDGLAALTNPGGIYTDDPMDSLPAPVRAEVKSLQQQITVAANSPYGATQAAKKLGELQARLDEYTDEVIKSKPEEQRPAFREYYETGGLINNPEAAASYLVQALPNPATLAHDFVYGPIWEQFGSAYLEIAGQDFTTLDVGGEGTGLTIAKTDKPNDVDILEKAARQVRDQAIGTMYQSYAAETIVRLQAQSTDPIGEGGQVNIWDGIVNPNTLTFDDRIYDVDAEGNKTFDLGRFSQYLAAKTFSLRDKGVLQPGESLNQMLENVMRRNTAAYTIEAGHGSVEKAAMNNILFGNNLSYYLGQAVNDFGNYTDSTLMIAAERSQEITEQIDNLTKDPRPQAPGARARQQQTGGPAVLPPLGSRPYEENAGDDVLFNSIMRGQQ